MKRLKYFQFRPYPIIRKVLIPVVFPSAVKQRDWNSLNIVTSVLINLNKLIVLALFFMTDLIKLVIVIINHKIYQNEHRYIKNPKKNNF